MSKGQSRSNSIASDTEDPVLLSGPSSAPLRTPSRPNRVLFPGHRSPGLLNQNFENTFSAPRQTTSNMVQSIIDPPGSQAADPPSELQLEHEQVEGEQALAPPPDLVQSVAELTAMIQDLRNDVAVLKRADSVRIIKEEEHRLPIVPEILEVPKKPLDGTLAEEEDIVFPVNTEDPWWAKERQAFHSRPKRRPTPLLEFLLAFDIPDLCQ
jgi:hypothetical protein